MQVVKIKINSLKDIILTSKFVDSHVKEGLHKFSNELIFFSVSGVLKIVLEILSQEIDSKLLVVSQIKQH